MFIPATGYDDVVVSFNRNKNLEMFFQKPTMQERRCLRRLRLRGTQSYSRRPPGITRRHRVLSCHFSWEGVRSRRDSLGQDCSPGHVLWERKSAWERETPRNCPPNELIFFKKILGIATRHGPCWVESQPWCKLSHIEICEVICK